MAFGLSIGLITASQAADRLIVDNGELVSEHLGRRLAGQHLVGAILTLGEGTGRLNAKIVGVQVEPGPMGATQVLYDLRLVDVQGRQTAFCDLSPGNDRLAFILPGRLEQDGRFVRGDGLEFACTAGAAGKCIRFGFQPWGIGTEAVVAEARFNACIRMVRADYCGDGRSFTRDGTIIAFRDSSVDLQSSQDIMPAGYAFEAAWGPDGALCVARSRIDDLIDLTALAVACPRLAGRVGPKTCRPGMAGGLIENFSEPGP